MDPLRVLNFGAGVQSTTLLALVVYGKLPRPDRVVFADTGWEPPEVAEHLEDCKRVCEEAGLPLDIVRLADIRRDHIQRAAGLPVNGGYRATDPATRAMRAIPLFLLNPTTGKRGMLRRSCTHRYKIHPIERHIRQLLRAAGERKRPVEQWFGISTDEQERERISQIPNWTFRYPLLYEVPMSRAQCIAYMAELGITAPKSACIGCPYRNRTQWDYIRARPDLWADVVAFDAAMRHMPGLDSLCFIHPQRVPLDQVDWSKMGEREEHAGMRQECSGMCGV